MTAKEILKKYYGFDEFREGQEEIISNILNGKDSLGIMPTGAGKSVCYQAPAMLFGGISIVISPLISLMRDQVISLKEVGINAAYINSSLTASQIQLVLQNANKGKYKIIYVAPERLNSPQFLEFATQTEISMVTVDEAHCISQWGQDFRPSYSEIPIFIDKLKSRPVLSAFTATATEKVKEDIIKLLELKNPKVLVTGFDRKNLYFEVQQPKNKSKALIEFVERNKNESGIVYCTSRNTVEILCDLLNEKGYSATRYHAGLTAEERKQNQDDFIKDTKRIMVATNAFGMGIDKSNVNYVAHYNMPKDIESYYQEAGRAGRDGRDATCALFYSPQDIRTIKWMIENDENDKGVRSEKEKEILKGREYERLNVMTYYCTTTNCLRAYILKYFGETIGDNCGNCSNCNKKANLVNVTEISRLILQCVKQLSERFGATMVISILRGSKKEAVTSRGFDKLPCFNSTTISDKEIAFIIANLVHEGYLKQEGDKYPILCLGEKAEDVLIDGISVEMNVPKELAKAKKSEWKSSDNAQKSEEKAVSSRVKKQVSDEDQGLFDSLRTLRAKLAVENKVPAYVIFDDKTLVNMCETKPQNSEEMLSVSGVGDIKLQRYGDIFMNEIANYMNAKTEKDENEFFDEGGTSAKIPQEIINSIAPFEQPELMTHITTKIQDELNSKKIFTKITAVMVCNWLTEKGYLENILNDKTKRLFKFPTKFGLSNGVNRELRTFGEKTYESNVYSIEIQKLIINNLNEIIMKRE